MATVSPAWRPILLPGECAPFGTPLFQPVADRMHGVLVVGGPLKLHVFRIRNDEELWFSIPARHWISGFDLRSGSLFVQDGPVLSGWDMTNGGSFGAVNFEKLAEGASDARWKPAPRSGGSASPVMLPNPPDSIYAVSDELNEGQQNVMKARTVAGWGALLEAADAFVKMRGQSHGAFSMDFHIKLSRWLGRGSILPGGRDITRARLAVDEAMDASAQAVFSAPVALSQQFRGQGAGEVFVLRQDGTLFGMDAMFATRGTITAFAPMPARAQLALAEVPKAAGGKECRLYYVTDQGGINAVNASRSTPESINGWGPSAGGLKREKLLPLQYIDGKLFGGGILDADFFVIPVDPNAPPLLTAFPDPAPMSAFSYQRGWVDYDVAPDDELVILNSGFSSRQMSYAANVRERRRGEFRGTNPPPHTYSLFFSGTGSGARPKSPPLLIEVSGLGYFNPALGIYLGNTTDSQDPSRTPHFPPDSIELASGAITAGEWSSPLPQIMWMRSKPVVAEQMMYGVARSMTIADYFAALFASEGQGRPSFWERAEAAVTAATAQGKSGAEALKDIPLPSLPGAEAVVAFALSPIREAAGTKVQAGLDRIARVAKPY